MYVRARARRESQRQRMRMKERVLGAEMCVCECSFFSRQSALKIFNLKAVYCCIGVDQSFRWRSLHLLCKKFLSLAESYGKIIASEA